MEHYNFVEVQVQRDGTVCVYGNGGCLFEVKGEYVSVKTAIDSQQSKISGEGPKT